MVRLMIAVAASNKMMANSISVSRTRSTLWVIMVEICAGPEMTLEMLPTLDLALDRLCVCSRVKPHNDGICVLRTDVATLAMCAQAPDSCRRFLGFDDTCIDERYDSQWFTGEPHRSLR